ncbi:MAG: hypothetical protein IPK78_05825 [Rhodospirillales bacterium]|nr:hypothetical protein [Rhodospirillales bacterium]
MHSRLSCFLEAHLNATLAPLYKARESKLEGAARGLLWQMAEALGMLPRRLLLDQIHALSRADRRALAGLGVRLGVESVFLANLMKPRAMALRGLLWWLHATVGGAPPPPANGAGCR